MFEGPNECLGEASLFVEGIKCLRGDVTKIDGGIKHRLDLDGGSPGVTQEACEVSLRVTVETFCDVIHRGEGSALNLVSQTEVARKISGRRSGVHFLGKNSRFLPSMKYLRDPSVNFEVALGATAVIVLAGTLAGYFPARRAASIHPITALRTE